MKISAREEDDQLPTSSLLIRATAICLCIPLSWRPFLKLRTFTARQALRSLVTYCIKQILEYNAAAKGTAANVTRNEAAGLWEFLENGLPKPAYLHRGAYLGDPHCGVEYVRVLDDHQALRVARRLAQKKYHEHDLGEKKKKRSRSKRKRR